MSLPLWQRRIVVTRPRARSEAWVEAFANAGADVLLTPTIVLAPPAEKERREIERVLSSGRDDVWIAVTSPSSAEAIADLFDASHELTLSDERFRWAAVGEQTAGTLEARGVRLKIVAPGHNAASLAAEITSHDATPVVYHATSSKGRPDLLEAIMQSGGCGQRLLVTVNEPSAEFDAERLAREFEGRGIDALTFASPSAAEVFVDKVRAAGLFDRFQDVPAIAAGETTASALEEFEFRRIETATAPHAEAVVEATIHAITRSID